MLQFKYKTPLREISNKDIKFINNVSAPKQSSYVKHFRDTNTGNEVTFTDVDSIKFERNKIISRFFSQYSNKNCYQFFEFGIPYKVSQTVTPIVQKIKRRCVSGGLDLLAYIWVYDVGEENFGEHFHLVVATNRIVSVEYPNALKISYHKKDIHGAFVRNAKRLENYLKKKQVFERGYRKRLYGKSNNIKTK